MQPQLPQNPQGKFTPHDERYFKILLTLIWLPFSYMIYFPWSEDSNICTLCLYGFLILLLLPSSSSFIFFNLSFFSPSLPLCLSLSLTFSLFFFVSPFLPSLCLPSFLPQTHSIFTCFSSSEHSRFLPWITFNITVFASLTFRSLVLLLLRSSPLISWN